MNPTELKSNLAACRAELERITVTGVQQARSIAGIANALDQCIDGIDDLRAKSSTSKKKGD